MIGRVFLLPEQVAADNVAGRTVIVIDTLRATTTICHALVAGAADVVPCLEVAEAAALGTRIGRDNCLLGGERGGTRIDGFDLGNSPSEYSASRVAGKRVVFTTTNGTRAIAAAAAAGRIVLGALVNRAAVCRAVAGDSRVDIVCAGQRGVIAEEDILTAGAMVAYLKSAGAPDWNAAAEEALAAWRAAGGGGDDASLLQALRESRGGRHLIELGYDADIMAAAQLDSLDVVPIVSCDGNGIKIISSPRLRAAKQAPHV